MNWKQILAGIAAAALLACLGWLWTLVIDSARDSIRQQEQIETNAARLDMIKADDRVSDIVEELREIKQILNKNGM